MFEAAGDAQLPGVLAKGPFPGDEILVYAGWAVPAAGGGGVERQGTEGQGTVAVPHDGEFAAGVQGSGSEHVRGGIQESLSVASQACRLAASTSGNLPSREKRESRLLSATRELPPFVSQAGFRELEPRE